MCLPPALSCLCSYYSSTGWSPGISRLLNDCIDGLLWGDDSGSAAGQDGGGAAGSEPEAAAAAAQDPASTSTSGGGGAQTCPDPADLGFLSSSNSPTGKFPASGSSGSPGGVVATTRALLAEAVLLLDHEPALCQVEAEAAPGGGAAAAAHIA